MSFINDMELLIEFNINRVKKIKNHINRLKNS